MTFEEWYDSKYLGLAFSANGARVIAETTWYASREQALAEVEAEAESWGPITNRERSIVHGVAARVRAGKQEGKVGA